MVNQKAPMTRQRESSGCVRTIQSLLATRKEVDKMAAATMLISGDCLIEKGNVIAMFQILNDHPDWIFILPVPSVANLLRGVEGNYVFQFRNAMSALVKHAMNNWEDLKGNCSMENSVFLIIRTLYDDHKVALQCITE